MSEIQVQWRKVGPKEAADLLAISEGFLNRRLSKQVVAKYAAAMADGRWLVGGDGPIRLDTRGRVLDGQHRLHAIQLSGVVLELLVMTGVPVDAVDAVDTGRKRSLADRLHMSGEPQARSLASTISTHVRLISGTPQRAGARTPTVQEGRAHLAQHPGLRHATNLGTRIWRMARGPKAMYAAVVYEFARLDLEDAEAFVTELVDGIGLGERDPIYRLRELLLDQKRTKRPLPDWIIGALCIKAWNAWRDGTEMQQLRFRAGGRSPEPFPVAH